MPASSMPRKRPPRIDSRLPQVLDAAAAQFAAKGFQGASIRDIVGSVGMLPGSLYYHFATKDDLLAAVYAEGVRRISDAVETAAAGETDPWDRLEAACAAHLEAVLDRSAFANVVISVSPSSVPALTPTLVALRDGYERLFIEMIAALPLPPRTSRRTLRLMLLGALNWAPTWYRAQGAQSPGRLARAFVRLLRSNLKADASKPSGSDAPGRQDHPA